MAIKMLKSVGEAQAVDEGYAGFMDGEGAAEVEGLLEAGKGSATGKEIFDYVNGLAGTIYIFPIRKDSGLGSQYLEPRMMGSGVVFFNLAMSKDGKIGGQPFPPVIQLYHELGHAKQHGEWGPQQWDQICQAGKEPVTDTSVRLKTPYPMVLESDNMKRHEFPMCDEMGAVKRANYMDLKFI
ncbi:MAG: hypothetical protein AAFY59_09345 [Pseudomonadota bacterium]